METTDNPIKQKWWMYLLPIMQVLLGNLPARLWKIPLIASHLLVMTLIFTSLYWLAPAPKKMRPLKYVGTILLVGGFLLLILLGVPTLLSQYISKGWAFGITWFAFFQTLYWALYRLSPRNRKVTTGVLWLLLSLFFASIPVLSEYYTQSLIRSLRGN